MKMIFYFAIIANIALTGCHKAVNQKPALPNVDNAVLLSTLQKHFDDFQTCAILPSQFRNLLPDRPFRISIERVKRINENPIKSHQPFINAGLIRVVEPPKDQAEQYIYYELTELGKSSFSRSCRGWNEVHGENFKTRGFPVFDIRIDKILSSRPPSATCYVLSTDTKYQFRLENLSPWYNPQVFKPYVNRELSPQQEGVPFVWDTQLHRFVGDWKVGAFDFIHSNITCPTLIGD